MKTATQTVAVGTGTCLIMQDMSVRNSLIGYWVSELLGDRTEDGKVDINRELSLHPSWP